MIIMKTLIKIKNIGLTVVALLVTLFSIDGFSQACEGNKVTVSLSNIVSNPKTNSIEFDVNIANTGKNTLKLASLSGALIHKIDFATSGTFTVVTQPTAADFPNFNTIDFTAYAAETRQLRWTNNPVKEKAATYLPAGTVKKFARFRFTRTNAGASADLDAKLQFQEFVQKGYTAINAIVYCNGNSSYTALANRKMNNPKGYLIVAENGKTDDTMKEEFVAYAFPNPFTDNFKINIPSASESTIAIKVYDMLGKLIENKNLEKSELENVTIGSNYPSGIYNVNVSQGNNSQTLRIIKR